MGMNEVGGPATKKSSEVDGSLYSRLKDRVVAVDVMD